MKKSRLIGVVAISVMVVAFLSIALTKVSFTQDGGKAAVDKYPDGCVSCHIEMDGKDYKINTLLAKHKKHPKVTSLKEIPKDCTKCHKEGKKFGALETVIHKAHYQNPEKNYFLNDLQGDCASCHKMDAGTWKPVNKSGAKNW